MMVRLDCRVFWVLALAVGPLAALMAPNAAAENWAEKMFKEKSHDFRVVGRGTKSEHPFEFTNIYNEEVHIAAVRTSCGCTTPTVTRETLKTGQTGSVVATFNTETFTGQKAAVITVVFDRPQYAEIQLNVSGVIRTDITFDPPEVAFGEVAAGDTVQREVLVTHTGNANWTITDVRSHCSHLRVRLSEAQRMGGTVRYRMSVEMEPSMPAGEIRERLTLISNDGRFPTTEMSLSGRVRPSVSVSPAAISLGTLAPDGSAEKKLIVRGEEPFEITDVRCGDERFEFEVPVGKKKLHFVKLRFQADGTEAPVSQQIQVVTDLPGQKTAACTVTGSVSR